MADTDKNPRIVEVIGSDQLADHDLRETTDITSQDETDVTEEDILSQALVDVPEFPGGVQIHYSDEAEDVGGTMSVGGLQGETMNVGTLQRGTMITSNTEGVTFITSDGIESGDQLSEQLVNGTYQVLATGPSFVGDQVYSTEMNDDMALTNGTNVEEDGENGLGFQKIENDSLITTEQNVNVTDAENPLKAIMTVPNATAVTLSAPAPLGSSQNPIRIIQQGNQYTPVQQLSTDQLQQIMQVVQQQQVVSNQDNNSSVLFNPQTNTRIVYRVIYPSELHKDKVGVTNSMQTVSNITATPKKVYRKRNKEEEMDTRDGPYLSKEEKEMRKKARAKTRSGRISKPPKHMVKDFKHIHVLDYDEDYDDSDGGYSDYKVGESDDEERSRNDDNEPYIVPGLNSMRPKNWKCITCDKAYIGRAGLGRHLKLNPTHGSIDLEGDGEMVPPPPGTEVIMTVPSSTPDTTPTLSVANGTSNGTANSTASLSEDSRDSSYSLPNTPTPTPTPTRRGNSRGRPRGGRGWRGRGAYSKIDPEIRRRNKLRDLVRECTDEELMEIVLPRLAKVITLWEFLLMKVEKGDPAKPHADDVYTEFEKLHHCVKKLCQEYLQFVPETDSHKDTKILQVENPTVAEALGLTAGAHKVKEISESDSSITYKYKFLTTNHSVDFDYTNKSFLKRTVEVVSPEQIFSPTKKFKNRPIKTEIPGSPIKTNVSVDTKAIVVSMTSNSVLSKPSVLTSTANSLVSLSNTSPSKTVVTISHPMQNNLQTNTSYPKVVSLLSNSVLKKGTVPKQTKPSQPSQKYIIVSGMNSSVTSQLSQVVVNEGNQPVSLEKTVEPTYILPPPPSSEPQTENISSQKNIEIGLGASNSLESASVPQSIVLSTRSSETVQHMHVALPLSSQPSISPSNTESNTKIDSLLSISSQNGSDEISIPVTQDTQQTTQLMSSEEGVTNRVDHSGAVNEVSETSSSGMQNVMHSAPESTNDMFENQNGISEPMDTSQDEIGYAIVSESIIKEENGNEIVTMVKNEPDVEEGKAIRRGNQRSDDIIGVDSIDTSDKTGQVCQDVVHMESDSQAVIEQDSSVTTQYTSVKYVPVSDEQNSIISSEYSDVKYIPDGGEPSQIGLFQYEESPADPEQVETIQIPATNIFQTEDGAILIQNQDGTFIQLQSSDGQNVSMETVQALLANEGGSQFLEQNTYPNEPS